MLLEVFLKNLLNKWWLLLSPTPKNLISLWKMDLLLVKMRRKICKILKSLKPNPNNGICIEFYMQIVTLNSIILKTLSVNKLSGIHQPIFWVKLLKTPTELICVLDPLWQMVFIMIHIWELRELPLKILQWWKRVFNKSQKLTKLSREWF